MYFACMKMNIEKISALMHVLSPEPRLAIIMAIGKGETCVCHLESALGFRQAYISQQLMALREAGLLRTRREGKFVLYSLEKPEVLEMVQLAARLAGDEPSLIDTSSIMQAPCGCARCAISG